MINKLFTIGLALLIIISTNGVLFTTHLCEKTGITYADHCETCKINQKKEITCCESESSILLNPFFNDYNFKCCQSKLNEFKIDDKFLTIKSEQESVLKNYKQLILISFFSPQKILLAGRKSYLGLSPPEFKEIDLNILYSTFLI